MTKDLFRRIFITLYLALQTLLLPAQTTVYARQGMVASASQLASDIGRNVLKKGGNAIDAAVATAFALAVTWPAAGNIGGGGFIVSMNKDGKVTTFDFREKAPLAATSTMYLDASGNLINDINHNSILAVGVPGTVAGLYLAHQKYGRLPWATLVKPAVALARKGIPFTQALQRHSVSLEKRWKQYPGTAATMFKNGTDFYGLGEVWKQPDLAATLKRIQKKGRDGFYKGETAAKLAAFMKKSGGIITTEDLARYEAVERKAVMGTYHGYDIYSMPPPSSGGITLIQMLNILEGYDLDTLGYHSAGYIHILTEAMRRGFANRAQYLGDPTFNPDIPIEKLISKTYAAMLRNTIDPVKASVSDSLLFAQQYESESTTHLSVMDHEGNAVSLTYTLEASYGCQMVAEGLGFFLNNEMGDFNPQPGITNSSGQIGTPPNTIAPEKRMLSSMTPTIVAQHGKPVLVIGSPGGRTIINTVLQVILNVMDHDMSLEDGIMAGRIHFQWLPDVIYFEKFSLSNDTQKVLEKQGHTLQEMSLRAKQGAAMGIYYNKDRGLFSGSADFRAPDGGVAGY